MTGWMFYSLIAVALWGGVGLLQKMGTNRVSADSLLVWMMAGYVILLPFLLPVAHLSALGARDILIGTLVGITNGLGAWALFASLGSGAKASIAVPLTGLYPVVTVLLALVFLGERPTTLQWLGITFAAGAGVLMARETQQPPVSGNTGSGDAAD